MKQLLAVLFCCCLSYSCISAEEVSEFQVSIEERDAQMRDLSSEDKQEESNAYYYRIREINVDDRIITLEDDSRWDIGWWYRDVILNWQAGDRVTISADSFGWNEWGLQNLDRGSAAWGGILFNWFYPTPENSDSIVEVTYDDSDPDSGVYGKITLKSGFQFALVGLDFLPPFFEVGDAVFIIKYPELYIIRTLSGKTAKIATLLVVGNSDWRQESQ